MQFRTYRVIIDLISVGSFIVVTLSGGPCERRSGGEKNDIRQIKYGPYIAHAVAVSTLLSLKLCFG